MDKQKIVSWLIKYVNQSSKTDLLINLSDIHEINKELCLICKQTQIKTTAVILNNAESKKFCTDNNIKYYIYDEPLFNSWIIDLNENTKHNLCATYCKHVAGDNNLIVGDISKTDIIIRNYPDFDYYDILPFGNIYKSDLTKDIDSYYVNGLTVREIEWAIKLDQNKNILSANADPAKHNFWPFLTMKQKEIISKLYHIEKITRYKKNFNYDIFE